MEGNAPDHLSTPYVSNSEGDDYYEEDARYDNVDVSVVMRPDDGVDHELDEDPKNPQQSFARQSTDHHGLIACGGDSPNKVDQTGRTRSELSDSESGRTAYLSRANALTNLLEVESLSKAVVPCRQKHSNQYSSRAFHRTMRHNTGSYTNAGSQNSAEIENMPL